MKFNIGKRLGRLPPHERRIVERLKKGEITGEQAEQLLGGHVDEWRLKSGKDDSDDPSVWARPAAPDEPTEPAAETSEEEKARLLVERIAREVDAEGER